MAALTTRDQPATGELRVIGPAGIDEQPWLPVPGCPGVAEKELWHAGDLVAALIRYEPGARTPGQPHQIADHHIWVVAGTATIGGRRMVAGSYVHVPPTAAHPIEAGPVGCTILQLHHRSPAG
ncbi:MAG TPA: hypothetical protein VIL37_10040 [Natronosporangium sp.]